jgi:hypothetical protein
VARVTELNPGCADWYTAWSRLKTPHTHADILSRDESREAGKTTLRDFNNQYILYAREVTNAGRADLYSSISSGSACAAKTPKAARRREKGPSGRSLARWTFELCMP